MGAGKRCSILQLVKLEAPGGLQLVSDQPGIMCCGVLFLFMFGYLSLGTLSLRLKIMAAFSQYLS